MLCGAQHQHRQIPPHTTSIPEMGRGEGGGRGGTQVRSLPESISSYSTGKKVHKGKGYF